MVSSYKTPGVYIQEIAKFPPSVVPVETAIPAFIGYTANSQYQGESLLNRAVAVNSFLEFEEIFGEAPLIPGEGDANAMTVEIDADGNILGGIFDPNQESLARFLMAYALRHFYDNGGGKCYIISIGDYGTASTSAAGMVTEHTDGLTALAKEDEPTLIVFPDLSGMPADSGNVPSEYFSVLTSALRQCETLGDRFLISDLWNGSQPGDTEVVAFRNGIGTTALRYGAVYHPYIQTTLAWRWNEENIRVSQLPRPGDTGDSPFNDLRLPQLLSNEDNPDRETNSAIYANIRKALDRYTVILPPGAAVAGIYATVDRTRGVWKSPANVSLSSVRSLTVNINNHVNDDLNVHTTGKSINALRFFTGKGYLVWGARTLAGNDNEWRYVAVRRFFNMAEESIKKATEAFVFEPNDANTWTKVKAMIENFLILQWRAGALAGAKPEDAFYVRVGLGITMTAQDILEGRMNVEIGMAVVRPAEFIILKFSHKMQEA